MKELLIVLYVAALAIPLVPGTLIYFTNSEFLKSYFYETPLLETIFTFVYLAYIYMNDLLSNFRLIIGMACVCSTFLNIMLNDVLFKGGSLGYTRFFIIVLTLTLNIGGYIVMFFQQYYTNEQRRKHRRGGTFIIFYLLAAIFMSGLYKNMDQFKFPIFLAVLWIGFLVLHLNVVTNLRAPRCNAMSAGLSQLGALIYMCFYAYATIQFLNAHEYRFLIMKVLFSLANLLICLSAAVYEENYKKPVFLAPGTKKTQ